jgi:hypothetical protein
MWKLTLCYGTYFYQPSGGCFYLLVAIEWPNWGWYIGEHFFPPFGLDAFSIEWGHDMVCIFICCWEGFYLDENIINIVWMHIASSMMSHGTWLLQMGVSEYTSTSSPCWLIGWIMGCMLPISFN